MNGEGGVVDRRHASRKPRSPRVMTILVPPAVFQEVQAVFNSPVLANVPQEICGGYLLGIEAAHVVTCIVQHDFTIVCAQLSVDTQTNLTTGKIERFPDVIGVV